MQTQITRSRQSGQILIISILILGILLGIGFLFSALVARNITDTGRSIRRTVAGDLAEAGIRYAHYQMQYSVLGADWRPSGTPLTIAPGGLTRDPDAVFLRPASGIPFKNDTDTLLDRGGPDGLGPYTRLDYEKGRVLVRVRYAPADFGGFRSGAGNLRQPGKARAYMMIEAVGRAGKLTANDPSLQNLKAVKVAAYASNAEFRASLGEMKSLDVTSTNTRRLIAFAQTGLIDYARFVTNKYNVSRPAEFGSLTSTTGSDTLGVTYTESATFSVQVAVQSIFGGTSSDTSGNVLMAGSGSLRVNGDLSLHGSSLVYADPRLGDAVMVSGDIRPANSSSQLTFRTPLGDVAAGVLDSRNPAFSTQNGLLRDGVNDSDANGFPRTMGRMEPPSLTSVDPNSNLSRYVVLTRDSGALGADGRNLGRLGYGRGVYIDSTERGASQSETERETTAGRDSLVQEWLNPYSVNQTGGAWFGPYYRPVAASIQLLHDGFRITRHERSGRRYWRNLNGSNSALSSMRFRVRRIGNETYILNEMQNGGIINGVLADAQFTANGQRFNGVIFAEGDMQIRGVIPTDVQLSIVSMGSIYVNGSITKGVRTEAGVTLGRPSTSTCMLMAKDYSVVNTTMFFAPSLSETVTARSAQSLASTPTPESIVITPDTSDYNFETEMLLAPVTDAVIGSVLGNPSTWSPYALQYRDAVNNNRIPSNLVLSHSADNDGPTYISLNITPIGTQLGAVTTPYQFIGGVDAATGEFRNPEARRHFLPNDPVGVQTILGIPVYALSDATTQTYPRFEISSTELVSTAATYASTVISNGAGYIHGNYALATQDSTLFGFRMNALGGNASQNYVVARAAVNPSDVRIEASMFAEEGSFFVIPGPSFNLNSGDTRLAFNNDVANIGRPAAELRRYQLYGARPFAPFYGEPLNVKVSIVGSVTENMPQPIAVQAAWQRKWGWMPRQLAGTGFFIPTQHVPAGQNVNSGNALDAIVPNLTISHDPTLALGSADGVNPVRVDADGNGLAPMPRLPVSPTLSYFGEINP